MEYFSIKSLIRERASAGKRYLEFLKVPAMSAGLYVLTAGEEDQQQPHSEDEVYYIISGTSKFRCEDEDRDVGGGDVLYVPANAPHKFHTITEDLTILVIFAPEEYSLATPPEAATENV